MTTLSLVKPLLGPVQGVTVSGLGTSLTVNWTSLSGAVEYEVWRANVNNLEDATKQATVTTTNFSQSNVRGDLTYYFWVRGIDKYGKEGEFSGLDGRLGYQFNTLYMGVWAARTGFNQYVPALGIDVVECRVIHSEGDTGWKKFTSTITQVDGSRLWSNPNNSRLEDGVLTTAAQSYTPLYTLLYKLSDLGVPDIAVIESIQVRLKAQSDDYTKTRFRCYLTSDDGQLLLEPNYGDNTPTSDLTANNVLQTVSTTANLFGLSGAFGAQRPSGGISVYDMAETSCLDRNGNFTGFETWSTLVQTIDTSVGGEYILCTIDIAAQENLFVNFSLFAAVEISNVVVSSNARVQVILTYELFDNGTFEPVYGVARAVQLLDAAGATYSGFIPPSGPLPYTVINTQKVHNFNVELGNGFQRELRKDRSYQMSLRLKIFKEGTSSFDVNVTAAGLVPALAFVSGERV